jgi:hypothetical protein
MNENIQKQIEMLEKQIELDKKLLDLLKQDKALKEAIFKEMQPVYTPYQYPYLPQTPSFDPYDPDKLPSFDPYKITVTTTEPHSDIATTTISTHTSGYITTAK